MRVLVWIAFSHATVTQSNKPLSHKKTQVAHGRETGQFQSSDKRFSTPKMIVAKDVTTLRELCTIVTKRGAAMMFRVLFAETDPTDSWKGHLFEKPT